jgi:hypothetical protein
MFKVGGTNLSFEKRILQEQEQEQEQECKNKLNGYRKKLIDENIYAIDCPYCSEPLSIDDIKKRAVFTL